MRVFEPTVPLSRARAPVPDHEDVGLTAYVERAWEEAFSLSEKPCACPRCGSRHTVLLSRRSSRGRASPSFGCQSCKQGFNRRTGTPLARLRSPEKLRYLIPWLGQQTSIESVADDLGAGRGAVSRWVTAVRQWLLQLDPDGVWEARVRLGVRFAARTTCYECHYSGAVLHGGFNIDRTRKFLCPTCGATLQRLKLEALGIVLDMIIIQDVANTVLRNQSRQGRAPAFALPPNTEVAPLAPPAPKRIQPRKLRLDIGALPARSSVVRADRPVWGKRSRVEPDALPDRENKALTNFLMDAITRAYAPDVEPRPACPWCGESHVNPAHNSRGVPQYGCTQCGKVFSRLTGTPLSGMRHRDRLARFVQLLSQPLSYTQAAEELAVSTLLVSRHWVPKFRRWLLELDPSGVHERLAQLGAKPQAPPMVCPKCAWEGTMQLYGFASETHHLPVEHRIRQYRCPACKRTFRITALERRAA
ncbi:MULTISPECIES: DUF746 domain-containing protein [Paraburkholderia]|uniref:DUF746 domain-containing protein n=1 Tax=Paraburkholderia madseniana TaxID=2599607 RepID=A0AAP5BL24_9BURK|nr:MULTISPECIES: DUF746 domain-containing protein [Paraburkholderia]MCX4151012.1 DUF746 domain-containing protein [Paraburkholderia madseniana]MCX4176652.1 DUF746 domain-containing protein [Paraburkholderia madseniana]MDN7153944.1 DUF746 domain-containing protein [Paraburkholderia sp. WS6]MDQ6412826.1 DUF746 domain-containing protein [Paraburkholderia madseniana]MDQ6464643.1 DUF746 domain-containing protein [Paraburkholderia madseniana]